MRIIGPDELVFGVDNVEACESFLADYGLIADGEGRFAALDNTAITIRTKEDPSLPAPMKTASLLRQTIWGVEDQATLDQIVVELSKDRAVAKSADGTLSCCDDAGFEIAFRVTRRVKLDLPAELINSPGAAPGRGKNVIGANEDAEARPRTLSHIVYFVPDMDRMANFYIERLGFVVTDKFTNTGPFLRPEANDDHHVLFMIQTPEYMQGIEHLAFHMQGPTELMLAGSRMVKKGYASFWGPGRHKFGSNWFWYFNSPLGTHVEYDADMDKHDGDWVERQTPMTKDAAQMFLFENVEKWAPRRRPAPSAKMTSDLLLLCNIDDIAEGGSIGVAPDHRGRDRVLLVRQGEAIHGYINNCPHYDRAPLGWKKDAFLNGDQTRIMCAAHGALFRIEDGICELGPCMGQRLTPVDLIIREGRIYGRDIPERAYGITQQQTSGATA